MTRRRRFTDDAPTTPALRGDRCRCTGCGELFNSTYAFDRHRRGPYTDRRCLTPLAMSDEGFMKNARGYWLSPQKWTSIESMPDWHPTKKLAKQIEDDLIAVITETQP